MFPQGGRMGRFWAETARWGDIGHTRSLWRAAAGCGMSPPSSERAPRGLGRDFAGGSSTGVSTTHHSFFQPTLSNATDAVFWAVAIRVDYFRRNARKNMGWKEVQLAWKATALSRKCSLCGNVGHNKSGCDPKLRDYLFKKGIVDKISDAGDWLDMAGE